jgi:hypothetical protein
MALRTVLELESSEEPTAQKLPPSALEWIMQTKDFALVEAKKFSPEKPGS